MVAGAVRKKRPCCVCRRWFLPDARVGARQRACGAENCQRARHREADRVWHTRHPDYDRSRLAGGGERGEGGRAVPRRRIGLRRWRECPGMSRKT
jgi:hypothetical protein